MSESIPISGWDQLEHDPEVSAKRIAEMHQMTAVSRSDQEKLAEWMITNGFATGHGDNLDDLLKELTWQVQELKEKVRS